MKIALVILHADPTRGGAERYTIDLAHALAGAGHDISLIDSEKLAVAGLTRAARYRHFLDQLDSHLEKNSYDIVHAMLPVPRCDVYHPHAGFAIADRSIWNARQTATARVEKKLLKSSSPPRVICLSNYVKAAMRKYYALDEAHSPVVFNAVDTDRFDPEKISPTERGGDEINALMIAQDFERKGLREALIAIAKVNDPRLRLRIVGGGAIGRYKKLASRLNISTRVEFAGQLRDTRRAYRDADFFVLPTKHDPCSLVVLEALAMGLPVISTRFNGACEIMNDGVEGFVLNDPADSDALAEAMKKLCETQTRARMSAAAMKLRPRLAYEQHLNQMIEIYQKSFSEKSNLTPAARRAKVL